MSAPFNVGDVVVCVDASASPEGYVPEELIEGCRYTVFGVGEDPGGQWGVFLDEMESLGFAGGYLAWRFRKIDDEQIPEVLERLKSLGKNRERVS